MINVQKYVPAISAGLFALVIGLGGPASARDGRNAAAIGGLAAGAVVGGAIANGGLGYGAPAYYPGPDAYYDDARPVRRCYVERRPLYDDWGDVAGYRRVRVCD